MKHVAFAILLLNVLTGSVTAQAVEPAEGYITTPDKVRLFYKIEGSGPETLVVLHGGPGNSLESVRPDFVPLSNGRRVIYYDQRGQGRSDVIVDEKKLGFEQHVADLDAVRRHFNLEKLSLLGNSWGGLLASLYAVAHPDRIDRLILDASAPPIKGFLDDMGDEISRRMAKIYTQAQLERARATEPSAAWLKAKDALSVCREFYPLVLRVYTYSQRLDNLRFKGDLCAGPKETLRQQRSVNYAIWRSLGDYNLMSQLAAVKAPVLVIHGAADVIPLRSSEFWAYGYPNARLLLIEKAGHLAHVETPEVFFPAVETFLKGTFPADARKVQKPH